jgi:hypothetical protein
VYSKTRIDVGALFSASPVVVEGRLHCLSEDGDMYVVKTGPEYELLAKNSLNGVYGIACCFGREVVHPELQAPLLHPAGS